VFSSGKLGLGGVRRGPRTGNANVTNILRKRANILRKVLRTSARDCVRSRKLHITPTVGGINKHYQGEGTMRPTCKPIIAPWPEGETESSPLNLLHAELGRSDKGSRLQRNSWQTSRRRTATLSPE